MIGRQVGAMIRRSVRSRFRAVYWRRPAQMPEGPVVFACTHTGWHDGYVLFLAVRALGKPTLDWIVEFDAFPLFRYAGGMPFPAGDQARRVATIRETVRRMRDEGWSLMVFGDGELKPLGEPWEVGRAVDTVVKGVPGVRVIPVALVYEMGVHERPSAAVWMGEALEPGPELRNRAQSAIESLAEEARAMLRAVEPAGEILLAGTKDVNERWDMRRRPGGQR